MTEEDGEFFESVQRLSRDLRFTMVALSDQEARFLVDTYYQMQDARIRHEGQIRSMYDTREPHSVLTWFAQQFGTLERQLRRALDRYSFDHPDGDWLREQIGIGPVIAAGFLAHIDIQKAPTAGHIWSYAGLDPTMEWGKGQKRPYNAELKVICWKAGESFVKFHNHPDCIYGHLWRERKDLEIRKNEAGELADQAAHQLATKNYDRTTEAYKWYSQGKLPPAHIHARARRYAVKIFISHLHVQIYERVYRRPAPVPYPIAFLGHAHYIAPLQ